ncbi:MAG: glutathione S-transferase [Alphaproteobacteria bacterium]|nr:glutathione S-transferase [Alphaproteobacteria bacterium]
MSNYRLVIGNYNWSSWSMRGWLPLYMLKMQGLIDDFALTYVNLKMEGRTEEIIGAGGGARTVPVLFDGDKVIWESTVIIDYLAAKHKTAKFLPAHDDALWWGKVITQEMHSGFSALRGDCPMDIVTKVADFSASDAVLADVARINELWQKSFQQFGGQFLLGDEFTFADIIYAPVVTRFITYQLPCQHQQYLQAVMKHQAVQAWCKLAEDEMRGIKT